ncbi:MAG: polysaccharide biosynthesis protein, partial [Muribaculaceae bacterium]|nr:polysaccharide biosynthesis protein [Muribaculaceae bacterium]
MRPPAGTWYGHQRDHKGGEVEGATRFVTTRFGNVLGSNGSVIPI